MRNKFGKIAVFLFLIAAAAGIYFFWHSRNGNIENTKTNPASPADENMPRNVSAPDPPKNGQEPVAKEAPAAEQQPKQNLPAKFLLDMPFYSQAPLSKWDAFHEEMCEEASILNAGLFLEGKKLTKDQFEAELQKIQKIEKETVGAWKSTTVAETKKWADAYFDGNLKIKIIEKPTIEDIEAEISAGNPVVAPLAGRDIGNPNFTPPGPVYHMLVIKGFDAQNFITNDVGTRKGNSYTYKKSVIMENIHDWNEKNIHLGASRILVFSK